MIEFKNVSYKINNKTIIDSITFHIKENDKVLICGKSGSGKTTLFNLILRHIKSSKGDIFYKSKNIKEININSYRSNNVSMISQVDDLFEHISVFNNLSLFYYEDDIIEMLKRTNLLHLKNRIVSTLSGGERQKIAIIKSCLSNCEVLLCDEITSALDSENANLIIDFILSYFNDKTIIFISHDVSLFENKVNKIIEIENGKLIKNQSINYQLNKSKANKKIIKRKKLYKVALLQGIKNINIYSLLIFVILIICIYISLYFENIFLYFAKLSYEQYFNYDVVFIKDNSDLTADNKIIFQDISYAFDNSKVTINNQLINNIEFLPFNNKNNYNHIVVNDKLTNKLNINKIETLIISNNNFIFKINDVDIVSEDNTFTLPTIYYDFKYFLDNYSFVESNKLVMIVDNYLVDERFTNNPMYNEKKEDKPYIDSIAYMDYLTYEMIFSSIKEIVNYYFVIIMFYCFITSMLVNISILLKDSKQIAIYIARGYKDFQILLFYMVPLIIYSLFFVSLIVLIKNTLFPFVISFSIQLITIIISYYYLKSKSLYKLLKDDIYV